MAFADQSPSCGRGKIANIILILSCSHFHKDATVIDVNRRVTSIAKLAIYEGFRFSPLNATCDANCRSPVGDEFTYLLQNDHIIGLEGKESPPRGQSQPSDCTGRLIPTSHSKVSPCSRGSSPVSLKRGQLGNGGKPVGSMSQRNICPKMARILLRQVRVPYSQEVRHQSPRRSASFLYLNLDWGARVLLHNGCNRGQ